MLGFTHYIQTYRSLRDSPETGIMVAFEEESEDPEVRAGRAI